MRVKCDRCDMVVEHQKNLEEKLKVAIEALEYAISDVSTGHWEDDCKVPKTYEPCDHCYLVDVLSKIKGGE